MTQPAREYTFADFYPDTPEGAPISNQLVPDGPVVDELGELLADEPAPATTGLRLELFRELAALRAKKTLYETMAKALGGDIARVNAELVAHIAETTDADLRNKWNLTVDNATAYTKVADYPKYRHPLDAAEPYSMADLLPRLRECQHAGFAELVKETVNGSSWNAAIRRLVEEWRARVDETGAPLNADGQPVDAFGEVLTEAEAAEPTADELALPREIREVVSVSTTIDVMFRQK